MQHQQRYPAPTVPVPMTAQQQYPVHPDVKLKRLPFFDHMAELIKPSSLGKLLTYFLNLTEFVLG